MLFLKKNFSLSVMKLLHYLFFNFQNRWDLHFWDCFFLHAVKC
jgi:hypothetical protein